jgi:hypothetical protein
MMGDHRSSLDRTVVFTPYRFGRSRLLTARSRADLDRALPRAAGEVGWILVDRPRSPQIWPVSFFRKNL